MPPSEPVPAPSSGRTVLLLSGPNLNLLGSRQPHIYGQATLQDHVRCAARAAHDAGFELSHLQSNSEDTLVSAVHEAGGNADAIVVNAGALTHYSWALADALAAYKRGPVVELHISNPQAREPWRHTSVLAPVVAGSVAGLGSLGYELAVLAAVRLCANWPSESNL